MIQEMCVHTLYILCTWCIMCTAVLWATFKLKLIFPKNYVNSFLGYDNPTEGLTYSLSHIKTIRQLLYQHKLLRLWPGDFNSSVNHSQRLLLYHYDLVTRPTQPLANIMSFKHTVTSIYVEQDCDVVQEPITCPFFSETIKYQSINQSKV